MSSPQRSSWRVAVDGDTVCVGTAAMPSGGAASAAPAVCTALSWGGCPFSPLRNPSALLSAGLLCAIFERLDVRQRLRCATVCRAWRAVLTAPPAKHLVSPWRCVDLSAAAFPRRAGAGELAMHDFLLPRHGASIEELSLRGSDGTLMLVLLEVLECPHLRLLDLRDCSSEHGIFSAQLGAEILRAATTCQLQQPLTLLLDGTVVNRHTPATAALGMDIAPLIRPYRVEASNILRDFHAAPQNLRPHSDGYPYLLRTDVAVCPFSATRLSCAVLFVTPEPPPGVPPPPQDRVTGFVCSGCGVVACLVRSLFVLRCYAPS